MRRTIYLSAAPIAAMLFAIQMEAKPVPKTSNESPTKEITNSLGMKFVFLPSGTFTMGSSAAEIARLNQEAGLENYYNDQGPQHEVEITKGFYLGIHEVTIGQFGRFVQATNYRTESERDGKGGEGYDETGGKFRKDMKFSWKSAGFLVDERHPVMNVSWNDAKAFCAWLSEADKKEYGLPTEAEWEYACRAGTKTSHQGGDDPEALVLFGNVADGMAKARFPKLKGTILAKDGYEFSAPVGQFRKNEFGIFDMHGNVYEWCEDWYDEEYFKNSPRRDPKGPSTGSERAIRGGGWARTALDCRSAYRVGGGPSDRDHGLGFRVILRTIK